MSINVLVIDGNTTSDAELRTTQSGKKVLSFRIANNRRFGDSEQVNFLDCVVWGDERAEGLAPHIQKGTKLVLKGRLEYRQWERDGQKRSKHQMVVEEVTFAGAFKAEEAVDAAEVAALADDDIPF